jgi:molybdopterin-guanine dinucleotide biosynthesis protein A
MTLGAVVLCGGESRRMGQPKAWLPFGDERMLQRVVRLVRQAVQDVVVVAAPGQELPELPGEVTIVRDMVPGRGPLQGLAAGLSAMPTAVDFAYATGTDVPLLQPRWIETLARLIGEHDLAIPFVDAYYHALAALYRRSTILPAVEALLQADRLRPVYLMEAVRTRIVEVEELRAADPDLKTLRNLNTPEDYQESLRAWRPEAGG